MSIVDVLPPASLEAMRMTLTHALERITALEQRQGALTQGLPPGDGSFVSPVSAPSNLA